MSSIEAREHEAWITERKKSIDLYQPDKCSCRIGLHWLKQFKKTKCCLICSGCGGSIKGQEKELDIHHRICVAYKNLINSIKTYKPGDEIAQYVRQGSRCPYCDKGVKWGMLNWHWRNNPECSRYKHFNKGEGHASGT